MQYALFINYFLLAESLLGTELILSATLSVSVQVMEALVWDAAVGVVVPQL
jgi:hypothetical protein